MSFADPRGLRRPSACAMYWQAVMPRSSRNFNASACVGIDRTIFITRRRVLWLKAPIGLMIAPTTQPRSYVPLPRVRSLVRGRACPRPSCHIWEHLRAARSSGPTARICFKLDHGLRPKAWPCVEHSIPGLPGPRTWRHEDILKSGHVLRPKSWPDLRTPPGCQVRRPGGQTMFSNMAPCGAPHGASFETQATQAHHISGRQVRRPGGQ